MILSYLRLSSEDFGSRFVFLNTCLWVQNRLKPGSHRKIAKDYRPKLGKDQEILSESGWNPLKIVLKLQTIFPTDSHRLPPIQKSVEMGRFFKKKSVGVTWKSVGPKFFLKIGRFSHRFSPPIAPRQLSSMFDKIGGIQWFFFNFFPNRHISIKFE